MSLSYHSKKVILSALFCGELNWSRLMMSASSLVWGLLLLADQFIGDRVGFRIMLSALPHYLWGCLFIASAGTQFFIVVRKCFNNNFSLIFDGLNATLWCFVVSSIIVSDFPPPATISTEVVIMLLSCWVFIRSGSETKLRIDDGLGY